MDVQFEEIFSDLVNFREEIGAELVHVDYEVEPVRFLLYNPSEPGKFHFLACGSVKNRANLATWRRISYSNG